MKAAPFPRGGGFKSSLWDCKVTPAYCTCQERNTIGCISSNDGLGAGWWNCFPQVRFMVRSQMWGRGWRGWVFRSCAPIGGGNSAPEGAMELGAAASLKRRPDTSLAATGAKAQIRSG